MVIKDKEYQALFCDYGGNLNAGKIHYLADKNFAEGEREMKVPTKWRPTIQVDVRPLQLSYLLGRAKCLLEATKPLQPITNFSSVVEKTQRCEPIRRPLLTSSHQWLLDEEGYKVKKIVVNRDQRLSLQLHRNRMEVWHILSGVGEMQVGNCVWTVSAGDRVEIGKLEVHRITNEGDTPIVILELQTGDCQEDDIIRIEDDYGRTE